MKKLQKKKIESKVPKKKIELKVPKESIVFKKIRIFGTKMP